MDKHGGDRPVSLNSLSRGGNGVTKNVNLIFVKVLQIATRHGLIVCNRANLAAAAAALSWFQREVATNHVDELIQKTKAEALAVVEKFAGAVTE